MMEFLKKVILLVFALFALLSVSDLATPENIYAQDNLSGRINELTQQQDESGFLTSVVRLSVLVSILALIGLSAYAGFQMLTSSGNPEKINDAREILVNAFLGFGLIVLSIVILLIINEVLELPGIEPR